MPASSAGVNRLSQSPLESLSSVKIAQAEADDRQVRICSVERHLAGVMVAFAWDCQMKHLTHHSPREQPLQKQTTFSGVVQL